MIPARIMGTRFRRGLRSSECRRTRRRSPDPPVVHITEDAPSETTCRRFQEEHRWITSPWRTWLSASVLGPSAASYSAYLQRHGYSASITGAYLHAVGHFAHWLTEEHLTLRRLDESVVRRFLTTHLPTCRCPGRCQRTVVSVQAALGHLLDVLRADGRIPARRVGLSPAIHDELERFTSHLEHVCGLAAKTRAGRRWWVASVLGGSVRSRTDCGRPTHPHATSRTTWSDTGRATRQAPPASAAARCAATCVSAPHGAAIAWRP